MRSWRLFFGYKLCFVVADVFRPILPSPKEYGFRNKMTPHFNRPAKFAPPERHPIGYNDVDGRIVDIDSCPIVHPIVDDRYQKLRMEIRSRLFQFRNGATMSIRRRLLSPPRLRGGFEALVGNGDLASEVVNGVEFRFPPTSFFQTNPEILELCVQMIEREVYKYPAVTNLVDVYCGYRTVERHTHTHT